MEKTDREEGIQDLFFLPSTETSLPEEQTPQNDEPGWMEGRAGELSPRLARAKTGSQAAAIFLGKFLWFLDSTGWPSTH